MNEAWVLSSEDDGVYWWTASATRHQCVLEYWDVADNPGSSLENEAAVEKEIERLESLGVTFERIAVIPEGWNLINSRLVKQIEWKDEVDDPTAHTDSQSKTYVDSTVDFEKEALRHAVKAVWRLAQKQHFTVAKT